ncbi:MAG: alpha/beta fold hydrolase [Clostridiales bacterium]|nr:alpha/beta fold hydrolase [Clostridiales bacterium]
MENLSIDLRREYLLEGNNEGCLVIHGFTGTPAELRLLGEKVHEMGYTVYGVRLKGHGTTVEEMEQCTYRDWIDSVVDGYNLLKQRCEKVHVIGHSMGSLLALYMAENFEVESVAALAPPLFNKNKAANFAFIIKYFMKYSEWEPRERPEEEMKYLLGYNKVPIKSVHEFNKLNSLVKKNLNKIDKPLLIVYSTNDETVDAKSADYLNNNVKSKDKKVCKLQKSGHNITVECEREDCFKAVLEFLEGLKKK